MLIIYGERVCGEGLGRVGGTAEINNSVQGSVPVCHVYCLYMMPRRGMRRNSKS